MAVYYREIDVTEQSGSSLTDYQVEITFGSGDPIFTNASSDGSDLRFNESFGDSSPYLDHWVEEFDATNETATIWLKVPSLSSNGTSTVYVYYGDGQNKKDSDGQATFQFFDDFEDGTISSQWDDASNTTGLTESNGVLTATSTYAHLRSVATFDSADGLIAESKVTHGSMPENGYSPINVMVSGTDGWGSLVHPDSPHKVYYRDDGNWTDTYSGVDLGNKSPYITRLTSPGDGTGDIYWIGSDGNTFDSTTGVSNSYSGATVQLVRRSDDSDYSGQSMDADWHWVRVREYASTEPSTTTSSESTVAPNDPSNLAASDGSTNDEIDLTWTDNASSEDGFYIYRAQSSGSSATDYTQVGDVSANTTTYTDTGLSSGTRYFYRVSAYNTGGESGLTNEAWDTAPSDAKAYLSWKDTGDWDTAQSENNMSHPSYDLEMDVSQPEQVEAFTTTGSHTWNNPGVSEVDVLVVAGGGGGGGSPHGAGGGAGGIVRMLNYSVSGDISLTVGAGGAGGEGDNGDWDTDYGDNGDDSSFDGVTAIGGGGGGAYTSRISGDYDGQDGGSGGGATDESQPGSALQPGSTAYDDYGNGSIQGRINEYSSGGGGAGEDGDTDGDSQGGDGVDFSATFGTTYGENGVFGGGGGGGVYDTTASGPNGRSYGGTGGGGNGGVETNDGSGINLGEDGIANTGGGGGGSERDDSLSNSSDAYGGDGGSGIVLVKYQAASGNLTTSEKIS